MEEQSTELNQKLAQFSSDQNDCIKFIILLYLIIDIFLNILNRISFARIVEYPERII